MGCLLPSSSMACSILISFSMSRPYPLLISTVVVPYSSIRRRRGKVSSMRSSSSAFVLCSPCSKCHRHPRGCLRRSCLQCAFRTRLHVCQQRDNAYGIDKTGHYDVTRHINELTVAIFNVLAILCLDVGCRSNLFDFSIFDDDRCIQHQANVAQVSPFLGSLSAQVNNCFALCKRSLP